MLATLPRDIQRQAGLTCAGGPDQRGQPCVLQRFGEALVVPLRPTSDVSAGGRLPGCGFSHPSRRGHTVSLHLQEARDGPGVWLRPVLFPAVDRDIADVEQFGQLDLREAQRSANGANALAVHSVGHALHRACQ